tara:strand:+ start:3181 stop:3756 length:576 start_codon:yes stop_codon:yes gene_type:complete
LIVIIDNYDSFTYNLFQYASEFYSNILILKNDDPQIDLLAINKIKAFIFSPGPGHPKFSGKMPMLINAYYKKIPMLGICLGHQAIIENFGGVIINASNICHGKVHKIKHYSNSVIFDGVNTHFHATRYNSLVASKENFPECFKISATTVLDDEIMAIQHVKYPIFGLQFHPESIETQSGLKMIKNFIRVIN